MELLPNLVLRNEIKLNDVVNMVETGLARRFLGHQLGDKTIKD